MIDFFLIMASSRSGSNFFMSLLNSTGHLGNLAEYLSVLSQHNCHYSDAELLDIFEKLKSKHHSPLTGKWGMKVDLWELPYVHRYLALNQMSFCDVRWIWLRRRDKVKQAISGIRMSQSKIAKIHKNENVSDLKDRYNDIDIDVVRLQGQLFEKLLVDTMTEQFFRKHCIKPFKVDYEDIVDPSTWDLLINDVFAFLGVAEEAPFEVTTDYVEMSSYENIDLLKETLNETHRLAKHWPGLFGW